MIRIFQLCLFLASTLCAAADGFYSQKIYVQPLEDAVLRQSVTDLQELLKAATGRPFAVDTATGIKDEGIQILLWKPGLLNAALTRHLQSSTVEDFVMDASAGCLLLVAMHPLGLSRAIYTYLDQLGFKWYLPGDVWNVVPLRKSITLTGAVFYSPSFSLRGFFGTGGLQPVPSLDPTAQLEKFWDDWKRRNRFGEDIHLSGHYGDTFNINYKELLEKNPQWLAMVNGERRWSAMAKWCISNKGLRDLFIADRLLELKKRLKASAYANEKIAVTVDPADGYGDCECDDCRKMGPLNDRIFFLANEVAKAIEKVSPRGYANLFAYNTHPSPPPFTLRPNLIVQVVPYAFQSVANPEELIALWRKKHANLYVYDYYGIPDWHSDEPLSDGWSPQKFFGRVAFWKRQQLKGFVFETSYATGNAGLGLYMAGRMGWKAKETPEQIQQTFVAQLFGAAAPAVKLYYQKLQEGFGGVADVPFLLEQLRRAGEMTKDNAVLQRLTHLKAYVHYLILHYRARNGGQQGVDDLYRYLFGVYNRGVVHSTYLALLLQRQFANDGERTKYWRFLDPVGEGIRGIRFLDDGAIGQLFAEDIRQHPLLEGFPYLAKQNTVQYRISTVKSSSGGWMSEGLMLLDIPEILVKPSASGYVTFALKVNETSSNNESQSFTVQLTDTATGGEVTQKVSFNRQWLQVHLRGKAGKTYRLTLNRTNWIRLAVPQEQWLAFANIPTYAVMGKLWFYTADNHYFYFSNTANEQVVVKNQKGVAQKIETMNTEGLFRISVQPLSWYSIESSEYKALRFYDRRLLFFPNANVAVW